MRLGDVTLTQAAVGNLVLRGQDTDGPAFCVFAWLRGDPVPLV